MTHCYNVHILEIFFSFDSHNTKMPRLKLSNNNYINFMSLYIVVEGSHKNPNEIKTIDESSKKEHGPFTKKDEAEALAKALIQKNIDDFYHRAWVVKNN